MLDEGIVIVVIDREDVVHYIDVPTGLSLNLMEVLKAASLPILATCGGMALCSTCHCYIESEAELSPPTDDEEMMLDQTIAVEENSRLACQINVDEIPTGMVIRLAPEG